MGEEGKREEDLTNLNAGDETEEESRAAGFGDGA